MPFFFSAALSAVLCSCRTSEGQGLDLVVCTGQEERESISSRQEVKVVQKVSVALLTSRSKNWVCEGWRL